MKYLTILNSLAILFLFYKTGIVKVTIRRQETFWKKTLIGYMVGINKFYFIIPLRNERKTKLREEIKKMITEYNYWEKRQALAAKFSWLKTWEEVRQFEKDYSVVDSDMVKFLVDKKPS